jgi:hypothetical protein
MGLSEELSAGSRLCALDDGAPAESVTLAPFGVGVFRLEDGS